MTTVYKFLISVLLFFIIINGYVRAQKNNPVKDKNIALVVGVSHYQFSTSLKNTVNDANDVTAALKRMGFEVSTLIDPNRKQFNNAIDSLGRQLKKARVCLFYYAGHAAEFDGENYLFPVDAKPSIPNDIVYDAIPIGKILGKIDYESVSTSIIILDACRTNPFTRKWEKSGTSYEGLANMLAPSGSFIAFAAAPGKVASDGTGQNGLFTSAILKYIEEPELNIDQIFTNVNREVRLQSEGRQVPFTSSYLDDPYVFPTLVKLAATPQKELIKIKDPDSYVLIPAIIEDTGAPKPHKYYLSSLSTYADVSVDKLTYDRESDFLNVYFQKKKKLDWEKASNVYVSIIQNVSAMTKDSTKTIYHYIKFEESYHLHGPKCKIKIRMNFDPGNYVIQAAIFYPAQTTEDNRTCYSTSFEVTVQ